MKLLTENILQRVVAAESFVGRHNKTEYFNQRYETYRIHCGVAMALDLALKDCNLLNQFNNEYLQAI